MKRYTYSNQYVDATWFVYITKSVYTQAHRLYLGLTDANDHSLVCDVTVFIPMVSLANDEILVKTWGEERMDLWLIEKGIATDTGRRIPAGYAEAAVMKLTPEFMAENNITTTVNVPTYAEI